MDLARTGNYRPMKCARKAIPCPHARTQQHTVSVPHTSHRWHLCATDHATHASDPILRVCSRRVPRHPAGTAFPSRGIDAARVVVEMDSIILPSAPFL